MPLSDYSRSSSTKYSGKLTEVPTELDECYVCGMEELGIPRDAHCADPFAKDLLPPAMPDHIAETKRKGFRKYCNYMDMKPWYINGSGIWGKWTGGCVVRWVDLSGVYTQRVCRIRDRPALGNHFVSKRLAKLEFALRKVDNGCMLSPMATLVPFSRGVSLYARLHVCVCSANWCNRAHWPAGSEGGWPVTAAAKYQVPALKLALCMPRSTTFATVCGSYSWKPALRYYRGNQDLKGQLIMQGLWVDKVLLAAVLRKYGELKI
ncbi:hypothetical protein MSG28_015238 [Choristoneura fumiferana]|uniref:Uncharacterized protein n=1 Tax=Choristoneura fumiferana TaxID=7141 RepID=A0ACC0L017_CHOFU|nr:hypothetical protein MSG28_015238 [Choristoneura fumiferana]